MRCCIASFWFCCISIPLPWKKHSFSLILLSFCFLLSHSASHMALHEAFEVWSFAFGWFCLSFAPGTLLSWREALLFFELETHIVSRSILFAKICAWGLCCGRQNFASIFFSCAFSMVLPIDRPCFSLTLLQQQLSLHCIHSSCVFFSACYVLSMHLGSK